MAEFSYTILPKKGLKVERLGLSVKSFSRNSFSGENFVALTPYWSATIGNRKNRSNINQDVLLKGLFGLKTSEFGSDESGAMAQYAFQYSKPDHQLSLKFRAEYVNGEQVQVGRVSLTAKYAWRYLKNKMERKLEVRAFFGSNVLYKQSLSPIQTYSDRYSLSMSG